ncbi:phosphatidate cytidylyltransferase [Desulfobacterales bacterium HSG16]|nr:phosphatidate cytidylyltransferase [Desulfobacterales bacterium HSG16]
MRNSHFKRLVTGFAALPFLIIPIAMGGIWFAALICVACLLAMAEYCRIVFNPKGDTISATFLFLAMICGGFAILAAAYLNNTSLMLGIIAICLIASAMFSLNRFKSDPYILENLANQIQAIIYIPLSLSFLLLIRNSELGAHWIFFLLVIVFAGDIGAYYAGSYLGRHKLCPSVSPGKTIEGSIGGILANIFVGFLFKIFFLPQLALGPELFLFFILVGSCGQAGDLFESMFKRNSGIKDSGNILPGHGGILDRIDALLFAAPIAFVFKMYLLV